MRPFAKIAVACALIVGCAAAGAEEAKVGMAKEGAIVAQPLASALEAVGRKTGLQIVYVTEVVEGKESKGAPEGLGAAEILEKVLEGTGLTFKFLTEKTVSIQVTKARKADAEGTRIHLAEIENPSTEQAAASGDEQSGNPIGAAPAETEHVTLEEITVTGSRIARTASDGPQDVRVYTREQIDQSGQTNVADFLNTLPGASINAQESASFFTPLGTTAVQLRGLPLGTTLVLINGRRVEASGAASANAEYFDLNSIPLAAVERVDVLASGSSAIYGSDAIAGVVNIILKQDLNGFEARLKYGAASGTDDMNGSATWGKRWEKGSLTFVGSYQDRSELIASERSITADADYSAFGGPNANSPVCHPGNVFSTDGSNLPGLDAPFAAVPAGVTGAATIADFQGTAGTLNECALTKDISLIPETRRTGAFIQGYYELAPSVELFAEFLYSRVKEFQYLTHRFLFGLDGFQDFTVSAANPYNPFGTTVGIADVFENIPRNGQFLDTTFRRPLLGARGSFREAWQWEFSTWESEDRSKNLNTLVNSDRDAIQDALNASDPGTALNPFSSGPAGDPSLLRSFYSDELINYVGRTQAVNAFVRGSLLRLPAGSVGFVLGSEYDRNTLSVDGTAFNRRSFAMFTEARIPIVDTLAVTAAHRYDHYNDFGKTNNTQFGAEWRPLPGLLVRATYAEAFKAPALSSLYTPVSTFESEIFDPVSEQTYLVPYLSGGNPNLRPLTGTSRSFGLVYSPEATPGLRASVTHWSVVEDNAIVSLNPQVIVDNAALFPGRVVRSADVNGIPGPIVSLDLTAVNFGKFEVAGFDYDLTYRWQSKIGVWTPSLSVSQTYRYKGALVPGAPAEDRVSRASVDGNFAPRWKGALGLNWSRGPLAASVNGRYVGDYRDYAPLPDGSTQTLGNFWYVDANFRYSASSRLSLTVGAANLFDKLPQFSNFGDGAAGYDGAQADIRGRFLYAELGTKW